jgi:hypothetical protein
MKRVATQLAFEEFRPTKLWVPPAKGVPFEF